MLKKLKIHQLNDIQNKMYAGAVRLWIRRCGTSLCMFKCSFHDGSRMSVMSCDSSAGRIDCYDFCNRQRLGDAMTGTYKIYRPHDLDNEYQDNAYIIMSFLYRSFSRIRLLKLSAVSNRSIAIRGRCYISHFGRGFKFVNLKFLCDSSNFTKC